jgi:hypothetical protein
MNPEDICKLAANGNSEAERFCLAWVRTAHLWDDCVDGDKPVLCEDMAKTMADFTLEVAGNPFFQEHKWGLVSLMVQSGNYWAESNDRVGAERDILKAMWHSVIFHTAFIVGGWDWLREVTGQCIDFDYETDSVPVKGVV